MCLLDWYFTDQSQLSVWQEALQFLKSTFISAENEEVSSYMIQYPLSLVSKLGLQKREYQSW